MSEKGRARSKTKESSKRAKQRPFKNLFAAGVQDLVPIDLADRLSSKKKNRAIPVKASEKFRFEKTLTSAQVRTPNVTSLSQLAVQQQPNAQGLEAKSSKNKNADALQPSQAKRTAALFLVTVVLSVGYLLADQSPSPKKAPARSSTQSEGIERESPEFRERVEFHRSAVGSHLNHQRIGVELENYQTAPKLPPDTRKLASPDIMRGAPLMSEEHHRHSSRDRSEPLNPNYPDARVGYVLQEKQDMREWEKRAQQKFVDDFVQNAARAGIKVRVDQSGNVVVEGRPNPQ